MDNQPGLKITALRQTETSAAPSDATILRGAVIGGIVNGLINGAIQAWLLWDRTSIPLTVNGIINDEQTVFGEAVPLAVTLAMILTVIAYLTLKAPKRPFLPTVLWLTIKQGLFVFGLIVSLAVVWQRVMGTVSVSLLPALIILSIIAGLVAGAVNLMTIRASLLRSP